MTLIVHAHTTRVAITHRDQGIPSLELRRLLTRDGLQYVWQGSALALGFTFLFLPFILIQELTDAVENLVLASNGPQLIFFYSLFHQCQMVWWLLLAL